MCWATSMLCWQKQARRFSAKTTPARRHAGAGGMAPSALPFTPLFQVPHLAGSACSFTGLSVPVAYRWGGVAKATMPPVDKLVKVRFSCAAAVRPEEVRRNKVPTRRRVVAHFLIVMAFTGASQRHPRSDGIPQTRHSVTVPTSNHGTARACRYLTDRLPALPAAM